MPHQLIGKVTEVTSHYVLVDGITDFVSLGDQCCIVYRDVKIFGEVMALNESHIKILPFYPLDGIGVGADVYIGTALTSIYPSEGWLGRVIDGMGQPIDDLGPLPQGQMNVKIKGEILPAHKRRTLTERLDLGVKALDTFTACCKGQRMGIFAGSGVGKSVLMSMMTKNSKADVNVIGLIGERGREVQEFIKNELGEEGLANSVIIVATSDQFPMLRKQAAYVTLAVAEAFRNKGKDVLCMIDSVTRFAMAQREIGLSIGEPPTTKGYPPSVFSELPKLLERAGPGMEKMGNITGLFTVLVEGDDHNDPIADTVRSIVDGHIVLERKIAERGRYPAVDVLKSISRTMPDCLDDREDDLIIKAKKLIAQYEDMEELIRIGAYQTGKDPLIDEAVYYYPKFEEFFSQRKSEASTIESAFEDMETILTEKNAVSQ